MTSTKQTREDSVPFVYTECREEFTETGPGSVSRQGKYALHWGFSGKKNQNFLICVTFFYVTSQSLPMETPYLNTRYGEKKKWNK